MGEVMTLDELLSSNEQELIEWLSRYNVIHKCDCGYVVYDYSQINEIVQEEFGNEKCDEIFYWACNLSNKFGWMDIDHDTSDRKNNIYHCQYCAESEFSLINDILQIAHSNQIVDNDDENISANEIVSKNKYIVFIDESYSDQFPLNNGIYVYAAIIIPECECSNLCLEFNNAIKLSYDKGKSPKEFKYKKFKKNGNKLRIKIGENIAKAINNVKNLSIMTFVVPSDGIVNLQINDEKAFNYYEGKNTSDEVISGIKSQENKKQLVSNSYLYFTQIIINALIFYLNSLNATAKIIFDPVNNSYNDSISKETGKILELNLPIDTKLLRRKNKIILLNYVFKPVKDFIEIVKPAPSSELCMGLQLADFCAGDIRNFFEENHTIFSDCDNGNLLIPKNLILQELNHVSETNIKKLLYNNSFLSLYKEKFAKNLMSMCTTNGHLRHFNIISGEFFDLMD